MKHKKQHFVPRSYLEAWCDPNTPHGQEPFVWIFPKDSGTAHKRAPKNVFHEADLYTIHLAGGQRDLRLEHGLAELESRFVAVARSDFPEMTEIDHRTKVVVCAFVAAMQGRTIKQRDHMRSFWKWVLEDMEAMESQMRARLPSERKAIAAGTIRPGGGSPSLGIEDVRKLATTPLQHSLIPVIETQVPMLAEMSIAVFNAAPDTSFITSDAPCVWFDPEARHRPFPYNAVGLGWPTIEVTLPISPTQLLLFNRAGLEGYYRVTPKLVRELNRRTRGYAHEHFISSNDKADPYWFELDPDNLADAERSEERGDVEPRNRTTPPT